MPPWAIPALSLGFLFLLNFGIVLFGGGRLFERVKRLEDGSEGSQSTRDKVIQLETKLDSMKETFKETSDRQGRTLDNMSRQLATLATKGLGFAAE